MPHIQRDPTTEVMPNFDSDLFHTVFQPLVTEEKTLEDIIADTKKAWEEGHKRKVEQWEQQVAEEQEASAQLGEEREREEEARRNAQEELDRLERAERDKKKPKLKAFVPQKLVTTTSIAQLPQYAVNKIRNLEVPEMWYFTKEGCEEGQLQDRTTSGLAMTLTQGEDGLVLIPAAAHKPSTKVIPDHRLSYRQKMIVKTGLLTAMTNEPGWLREVINTLAGLFLEMDNHPLQRETHGEEALVIYMAEVRREWHEQLKSTDDNVQPFDISAVNEECVQRIYSGILNSKQASVIARSVTKSP
ncbi:hypothetical protein FA13DRAFT_1622819 [Coprinellus micaceus]|uniref:Uncharacterized protein n=1 Tax=Coprinellus micaceus TaxID=71717 RepID=A0A4Y7TSA5_COPMI|nr:hypothetical protein FA13DRAFT_1622819 [Coprinellus micaceus]